MMGGCRTADTHIIHHASHQDIYTWTLYSVSSIEILSNHFWNPSLLVFGEKTMSSGHRIVQDQVELTGLPRDIKPLFIPGLGS